MHGRVHEITAGIQPWIVRNLVGDAKVLSAESGFVAVKPRKYNGYIVILIRIYIYDWIRPAIGTTENAVSLGRI
jgi:hypothetical protein